LWQRAKMIMDSQFNCREQVLLILIIRQEIFLHRIETLNKPPAFWRAAWMVRREDISVMKGSLTPIWLKYIY